MQAAVSARTSLAQKTPPTGEPVTLEQVKDYCGVPADLTADDALLTQLITACRVALEAYTGRLFLEQVWVFSLEAFPWEMRLPFAPVTEVQTIQYTGSDGTPAEVPDTDYMAALDQAPARIQAAPGKSWPSTRRQFDAVVVTFKAGAKSGAEPPAPLVTALLQWISHLYDNRGPVVVGVTANEVPMTIKALVAEWVVTGTHQRWGDGIYR